MVKSSAIVSSIETASSVKSSTPSSVFDGGKVSLVGVAHSINDTYQAFLPPLLPEFIERLSLSKTQAGLLSVALRLPSLFQPFIGYLADHASLKAFVVLAPAMTTVFMSLLGSASTFPLLIIGLFLAGTSSACLHAVGPVMVGSLSGKQLGRGMSYWMVGGELGRVLGPLVVSVAITFLGFQGFPWLMVAGILASTVLALVLRNVNIEKLPEAVTSESATSHWRAVLRPMLPFILVLTWVLIARAFMVESLSTYLPLFLRDGGADLWFANASLSILEAAGVVGALTGGALSDRLGRRQVLLFSLLISSALMATFLLLQGWVLLPLLLLLGLTSLSIAPVLMAVVQEQFPDNRSLANGIYMAINFVGRSGIALLLGFIGDTFGMRISFFTGVIAPLFAIPAISRLIKSE